MDSLNAQPDKLNFVLVVIVVTPVWVLRWQSIPIYLKEYEHQPMMQYDLINFCVHVPASLKVKSVCL